jgi:hypothetical protein
VAQGDGVNFAWQNPVTGLREQTKSIPFPYQPADLRAITQEAFFRAWKTLQSDPNAGGFYGEIEIFKQIRAGRVTAELESDIDLIELMQSGWKQEDCAFAFCDPVTGARIVKPEWPGYLKEVLANNPGDSVSEVVIYATRYDFVVKRTDPKGLGDFAATHEYPDTDPPAAAREHPELDDLELIHQEVANFIDLEGGNPAPRATALALIDIARSLRRLLGEFTPPEPDELPRFSGQWGNRTQAEALQHFDETWDKLQAVCTCTGDGLTADGAYCVCPAGQARKRAAAVASRPESGLGGTDSKASPDTTKEPES